MSVGVSRGTSSDPGITVSISRDPALVRTVRLIAAAVARRTGQDEEFVEEIRLAVGEACGLLVGEKPADAGSLVDPVVVSLALGDQLTVVVSATGGVAAEPISAAADEVEPWALLRGLVDDFSIDQAGPTTRVTMSWALG